MKLLLLLLVLAGCGDAPADVGAAEQATPVAAQSVTRDDVAVTATYPGELVADAADLAPRVTGRLVEVAVRIGDPVTEDQVLARVDGEALRQQLLEARAQVRVAEATLVRAQAEAELGEREAARIAPLAEKELVSAHEADAVRARVAGLKAEVGVAEARVAEATARVARLAQEVTDATVVAPFDGVVAERYLDPGATVQAGTPVLRVVEGGPLRVRFRIPEHELAGLQPGLPLTVSTGGGVTASGTVERISGAVSPEDRSIAVEGLVDPDPGLRAGMFARVRVERRMIPDTLVVPGAALLERPSGDQMVTGVFTAAGNAARWVPVEVQGRAGDDVAVAGSLEEGDRVLVLGHEGLRDGAVIQLEEVGR